MINKIDKEELYDWSEKDGIDMVLIREINTPCDSKDISPLPNRSMRICINGDTPWVRPLKLTGTSLLVRILTMVCKTVKIGEEITIDINQISAIDGFRKDKVKEIINSIIKSGTATLADNYGNIKTRERNT